MGSRITILLVFRSRKSGSCRSRDRRGLVSQKEIKFCRKGQQLRKRLNQHFCCYRVRSKTTQKIRRAIPTCSVGDMMSSRINTPLSCNRTCDNCRLQLFCLLLYLTKTQNLAWDDERCTRHSALNFTCFLFRRGEHISTKNTYTRYNIPTK